MFWDAKPLRPKCIVCDAVATVMVVDNEGNEVGLHCGPHADERVNTENEDAFKALRESEAARLKAERLAAEDEVAAQS